jgi:hypothetical protein
MKYEKKKRTIKQTNQRSCGTSGREMRGGTKERVCISRTIHHLGCFGEVEKHIAVMTELTVLKFPSDEE